MKEIKTLKDLNVVANLSGEGMFYIADNNELRKCTLEELFNAIAFHIGWRFDSSKIQKATIIPVVRFAGNVRLYNGCETGEPEINQEDVEKLCRVLKMKIFPYSGTYDNDDEMSDEEIKRRDEAEDAKMEAFWKGPTTLSMYNLNGRKVFTASLEKEGEKHVWRPRGIYASISEVSGMLKMIRELISWNRIGDDIDDSYFGDEEPVYLK